MHSCSAGRSERSLISRTSRTSSLHQPSTTTQATATRLTFIFQVTRVAIRLELTVFWFSIFLPRSAGKLGKFPCAPLGISQRTSMLTIALQQQAIQEAVASATLIKVVSVLVSL